MAHVTKPVDHTDGARKSLLIVVLLFALQLLDGIDQSALSFTAPYLRPDLGIGVKQLGAAFSAAYIGTALGAVLFGTLADQIGRKVALCVAALSFSAGSLATIWVTTGGQLIAARLFTGVALGGLLPVVASLTFEAVSQRYRATAITLVSVGTAAGVALCGPLVTFLQPAFGWRSVFIVGGVAPALIALVAYFVIDGTRTRDTASAASPIVRNPIGSVTSLFRKGRWRTTLALWLAFVAGAVPMFFTLSWLPSLAQAAGIAPAIAATGTSLFSVAGLVFALIVARLVDRAGFVPIAVTTALAAPAFIFLGQSFGSTPVFLIACVLAGALCVSAVNLFAAVAGAVYDGELRARGVGWAVAVMRLGAALMPWFGGLLIAQSFSVATIFTALALAPLISGGAVFLLVRRIP